MSGRGRRAEGRGLDQNTEQEGDTPRLGSAPGRRAVGTGAGSLTRGIIRNRIMAVGMAMGFYGGRPGAVRAFQVRQPSRQQHRRREHGRQYRVNPGLCPHRLNDSDRVRFRHL